MEKFNKSRAQELAMAIQNLKESMEQDKHKLANMMAELKERCSHPDDCVRKVSDFRTRTGQLREIWYCDICQQTQNKRGRTK